MFLAIEIKLEIKPESVSLSLAAFCNFNKAAETVRFLISFDVIPYLSDNSRMFSAQSLEPSGPITAFLISVACLELLIK